MPKTVNYRKLWEIANNTTIPKGYHIHHIDGNHNNNDINNLMCVSPEEHHNIHLSQGDIVALNGKFIQGASEAGKLGGAKSKPRWKEGDKKKTLSEGLKNYYAENGGSPLKGKLISDSHKKKISISMTGEKNPMYGKSHSDEVKQLLSEIGKTKTGELNNFYGKTHTDKTRELFRQYAKTRTGEKNPLYGRSIVREKNLKWYTNGTNVIYVTEGTEPDGYKRGRKLNDNG
jgi:hypothetical protein